MLGSGLRSDGGGILCQIPVLNIVVKPHICGTVEVFFKNKTKKTLNTKPRGTWTVFRCSEPLPWVCTPGFVPLWAISSSPSHLSSAPVSGISQFQVGKTILTGLGKWKKFLVMEIPSTLNQYFIHVWEIPLCCCFHFNLLQHFLF